MTKILLLLLAVLPLCARAQTTNYVIFDSAVMESSVEDALYTDDYDSDFDAGLLFGFTVFAGAYGFYMIRQAVPVSNDSEGEQ